MSFEYCGIPLAYVSCIGSFWKNAIRRLFKDGPTYTGLDIYFLDMFAKPCRRPRSEEHDNLREFTKDSLKSLESLTLILG